MGAGSRLSGSTIWQRASLVRTFVELQSVQASIGDVWSRCCEPLGKLMNARDVAVVLRSQSEDRLICEVIDGVRTPSAAEAPGPSALALEVLAANATVMRETNDPYETSIGVPIRFGPTLLGAICVARAGRPDTELLTLFESCALSAGARIHADTMIDNSARYERLAFADALTGIANRRRFDEALDVEWSRASRRMVGEAASAMTNWASSPSIC